MTTEIVKDRRFLSWLYVPDKVAYRDEQYSEITRTFKRMDTGTHLVLHGPAGAGKTALIKAILKELPEYRPDLHAAYVVSGSTEHSTAINIATALDPKQRIKTRGYSTEDIAAQYIAKPVAEWAEKAESTLLVLDDIDLLLTEKYVPRGLFYYLSRTDMLNTCIIVNHGMMLLDKMLGTQSQSTYLADEINFPAYNLNQIVWILRERCELGLNENTYSDDTLLTIAKAAEQHVMGDVRFAIRLLAAAANNAEQREHPEITVDDVREEIDAVDLNRTNILKALKRPELLIVALVYGNKENEIEAPVLYRLYNQEASKRELKRYTSVNLWHIVNRLSNTGLLETYTTGKKRGKGRVNVVCKTDYYKNKDIVKQIEALTYWELGTVETRERKLHGVFGGDLSG